MSSCSGRFSNFALLQKFLSLIETISVHLIEQFLILMNRINLSCFFLCRVRNYKQVISSICLNLFRRKNCICVCYQIHNFINLLSGFVRVLCISYEVVLVSVQSRNLLFLALGEKIILKLISFCR